MRYVGVLSGKTVDVHDGHIEVEIPGNGGEIWVPYDVESCVSETATAEITVEEVTVPHEPVTEPHDEKSLSEDDIPWHKSYEEMTVEELQRVIYAKMKANGPVTDRMYQDIVENVYHDSLVNWAKSFR